MLRKDAENRLKGYLEHVTRSHYPLDLVDPNYDNQDNLVLAEVHTKPGSSGFACDLVQDALHDTNKRLRLNDKDSPVSFSLTPYNPSSTIAYKEVKSSGKGVPLGQDNDYNPKDAVDCITNPAYENLVLDDLEVGDLNYKQNKEPNEECENFWSKAMIVHIEFATLQARLLAAKRRIRRTIDVQLKRGILDIQCQGDLYLAKLTEMLDSWPGFTRSVDQRTFHDAFIKANLPKIYGKDWDSNCVRVMKQFDLKSIEYDVLCMTPR